MAQAMIEQIDGAMEQMAQTHALALAARQSCMHCCTAQEISEDMADGWCARGASSAKVALPTVTVARRATRRAAGDARLSEAPDALADIMAAADATADQASEESRQEATTALADQQRQRRRLMRAELIVLEAAAAEHNARMAHHSAVHAATRRQAICILQCYARSRGDTGEWGSSDGDEGEYTVSGDDDAPMDIAIGSDDGADS